MSRGRRCSARPRIDPQLTRSGSAILISAIQLAWGRSQESQADHLGLIYMAKAGCDPRAARELSVRVAQAALGSAGAPEFLLTHPSRETRIHQIEGWPIEALYSYKRAC